MAEPDYVYEKREALDQRIERLVERARDARREAAHASHQPGLLGPQRAAESEAEQLEAEIASLREVAVRVDRGFPYWERFGFEIALDAYGDPWTWQTLSESVTRDYVFPHDDATLRLPVEMQTAYGTAVESGFFARYEVCSTFDTDGVDTVLSAYSYLFGVQTFAGLGECHFYLGGWASEVAE